MNSARAAELRRAPPKSPNRPFSETVDPWLRPAVRTLYPRWETNTPSAATARRLSPASNRQRDGRGAFMSPGRVVGGRRRRRRGMPLGRRRGARSRGRRWLRRWDPPPAGGGAAAGRTATGGPAAGRAGAGAPDPIARAVRASPVPLRTAPYIARTRTA